MNKNKTKKLNFNKIMTIVGLLIVFLCISSISLAYVSQKIELYCHGKKFTFTGGGGGNSMSNPVETCDSNPYVKVWGADYDICWVNPGSTSEYWTGWNYQNASNLPYTYHPDKTFSVGYMWRPSCNHDHYQSETPKSEWLYVYVKRVNHNYGSWVMNGSKHWKACSMCGGKTSEGNHRDNDRNGRCDDCNYLMAIKISIPTAKSNLVYNGASQTGVDGGTGYTLTNASKIDAGTYTAVATLQSGYMWSDGTSTTKSISWKINPKSISLTWTNLQFEADGSIHVPSVTGSTGIAGETATFSVSGGSRFYGTHTAVAAITAVTGGRQRKENYAISNPTNDFLITDSIAPSLTGSSIPATGIWTNNNYAITLVATDKNGPNDGSGIQKIQRSYNQTSWTDIKVDNDTSHINLSYTDTLTEAQSRTVYYRAVDRGGNLSNVWSVEVNIDKTAPTVTITSATDERWISFNIKDNHANNSKLFWFGKTRNSTDVISEDTISANEIIIGTNYDTAYRLQNVEERNVQMFVESSGTYYLKSADLAGNIATKPFVVTLRKINDCEITVTGNFTYDGAPKYPVVSVFDPVKNKTLVENTDFTVEIEKDENDVIQNINAGNHQVIVKGIGNYEGQGTGIFTIQKRDLIITPLKNQVIMEGVADTEILFTTSNQVNGEIPNFEGSLAKEDEVTAGHYKIIQGSLQMIDNGRFKAANYQLVFNNPFSYPGPLVPTPDPLPNPNEVITIEVTDFNGMKTIWTIGNSNKTIKLPIPAKAKNSFKVSWGDGTYDEYTTENFPEHTYASAGNYTIIVAGTVVSFGYYGDATPTQSNAYKDYYSFTNCLKQIVKYGDINAERIGFSNCSKLAGTLPELTGFSKVTSIENMFNGCTSLTNSIPTGYFKNLPNIKSARNVFYNCSNLTGFLDATMFENDTHILSFEGAFTNCAKLAGNIPSNMFATNTNVLSFARTFENDTSLAGPLPNDLFASNRKVQSFSQTFASCTGITSIGATMFSQNTVCTNYYRTFYNCAGLTTIPNALLSNTSIQRISDDPLSKNDFNGTFERCTGLAGEITFDNVLIGRSMFKDCNNITQITLPYAGELAAEAFYGDNKLTHVVISNNNLSSISQDAFEYTLGGENLLTYINKDNEMLLNYVWNDDFRRLDTVAPKGAVEIVSPRYPFTNTENVTLKITSDDENCMIAIINDRTYDEIQKINQALISQGDTGEIYTFDWKPYALNKEWVLDTNEGIKTVYVYFKDELGNISNVEVNFN